MILILDNYDSFTYNLVDYFQQLGLEVDVIRNTMPRYQIDFKKYHGLVLSPGPEKPEKAGILMEVVKTQVGKLPILGICLGHQALGQYFGAKLVKASYPMHGKLSTIKVKNSVLFSGIPQKIEVVRYHSLILQSLPPALKITAETDTSEIMAFEHIQSKTAGIQFHPEAILTQYGLEMLKNWATFYNIV